MSDTDTDIATHGQDAEFEAAFAELNKPPVQARGGEAGEEDDGEAGSAAAEPAEKDGAAEAAPDKVIDPWEGATPAQIAARDALISERDRLQHSDQSQRGRIAGLNRTVAELRSGKPQQPQAEKKEDAQGEGGQADAGAERLERMRQLREDYPDVAGPILDLLEDTRREMETLRANVDPAIAAAGDAEARLATQALLAKHPDAVAVSNSADFNGWAESQPVAVQALVNSFDPAEVSAVLTLFKTERDASKGADDPPPQEQQQRDDRRAKQLQGARAPASKPVPAAAGVPEDFDSAFRHYQKKREASHR